jgi:NADH:ubiquinone oxidoreductase subunit 3 (subunit A)
MGDIVLVYLLQNILLFGLIFWSLTWVAEYFYTKKNHLTKKDFYECGFKSNTELNIQININFPMLCVWCVEYDIEFTLLFPMLFNITNVTLTEFLLLIIFVFLIIVSVKVTFVILKSIGNNSVNSISYSTHQTQSIGKFIFICIFNSVFDLNPHS